MTKDFTAAATAIAADRRAPHERHNASGAHSSRAIAANAAKVLDTTRRAWGDATRAACDASETEPTRPPRALKPKKRIVPRRSRWPSLIAALNHWSPKPL